MEMKFNDKYEYLSKFVDLMSALDDDLKLPSLREKQLLIELIIGNMSNDLNDTKYIRSISKKHRFYARTISIYKSKLVDKGWLIRPSPRKIALTSKVSLKEMPKFMKISLKMIYEESDKESS